MELSQTIIYIFWMHFKKGSRACLACKIFVNEDGTDVNVSERGAHTNSDLRLVRDRITVSFKKKKKIRREECRSERNMNRSL